jgi:hypothetical protein
MRPTNTLLIIAFLVMPVSQVAIAEDNYQAEYLNAVADYYEVSLDAVQVAHDAGVLADELPVLFFIAEQSNANTVGLTASRNSGQSWSKIAAAHNVNSGDFYVHSTDRIGSPAYRDIYFKFADLKRSEFSQVKLSDTEIINLANLRFLYKHYHYSQRIIMNWAGEGKGFAQINQMVYAVTLQMNTQNLAETTE